MTWTFVTAKEGFSKFAPVWDELNRRLFKGHPLLDSRFVGPLIQHFATEKDLLALHHANGSCASALLLTPSRIGVWRSFLPSQTQIAPILPEPGLDLRELARKLPGSAFVIEMLCQDPLYTALAPGRLDLPHEISPHATTLNIQVDGEFQDYWRKRSEGLRQNIRRTLRHLEKDGIMPDFRIVDSMEELSKALKRYGDLESKGWKGKAGTAIHENNTQGCFYQDVLLGFGEQKQAMVVELYLDKHLACSTLSIANDFMLVMLKTTHDEALRKYSPGRIVDYFHLQHEFSKKRFSVVEFYTNAKPELLSWGTSSRLINHITLYRSPGLQRLTQLYQLMKALRPLKTSVR
ncbi:MAG: GNAT family N-acetyltransferase [Gammaproteobacteria bacterium]